MTHDELREIIQGLRDQADALAVMIGDPVQFYTVEIPEELNFISYTVEGNVIKPDFWRR